MALSRSEIELLIKAKNQAQQAFDQLNGQLKTVTGESTKATTSMKGVEEGTKKAGVGATAAGVAFGLLAERVGRGLVSAFNETIAAANRLDSGLIGLRSVATAFRQDAGLAEDAARSLAKDGLLTVGEAATSLKNLLASGFGLDQAVTLVNRFKDSAAFGRQAALGFGQAVASATEGIKNGNSILVDNAGVTKNLSQILVEAGFAATDLSKASSDANVRMALFNGILKETNPQLGDAARYLDTAAGKQAQFNAQVEIAQQQIGKALQPALAAALEVLTPFAKVIGDMAPILVPLAAGLTAAVAPMVAMKAAAALGITSLGGMRDVMVQLGLASTTTATQIGGVGAATVRTSAILDQFGRPIQMVGTSAEATAGKLTLMQRASQAFILAGLVTAAYQAAKGLGEMAVEAKHAADESGSTGDRVKAVALEVAALSNPVSIATMKWQEWSDALGLVKIALVGVEDKLPEVGAAIRQANGDLELLQTEIQRIGNKGLLPVATLDQALALQERFVNIGNAAKVSGERVAGWRQELNTVAQAGGLQTLKQEIDLGVLSTKELSKEFGISEDAVKFYEKQLKAATDATKDHSKAQAEAEKKAEAWRKTQEDLAQVMEKVGLVTEQGVSAKLNDLVKVLNLAATQGTPALRAAVTVLYPEFEALTDAMRRSGLATEGVQAIFDRFATNSGQVITGVRNYTAALAGVAPVVQTNTNLTTEQAAALRQQQADLDALTGAYQAFGLKTPAELQKVAAESAKNYELLRTSGLATTEQLKTAYTQMIEDQRAATGKLPSYWETNVFPGITRVVQNIQTAVQGSFAQMLLGAKGFGEGFKDIWRSIKAGVLQILSEILSSFVNSFLKGILAALTGAKGGFSQAFTGLFGGGGGGVTGLPGVGGLLGKIPGLGGLLGAGGSGAAGAGGVAGLGNFTVGGLPGGAAGAGGLLSGILGGVGAGGAGLGLGFLGQKLFGGAGVKSGLFGGGSGAATGALIGSIVPGIGTAIGALIGGLSGVFGGLFGKTQGMKVNDARDQELLKYGGTGTGEGSGFLTLAGKLTEATGEAGGGKLFQDLIKANNFKEYEAALAAVNKTLDAFNAKTTEAVKNEQQQADAIAKVKEETEAKTAAVKEQIASIDQQLADLSKSEAPEEIMGAVEKAQREALEKQKDALQQQLQEFQETGQKALNELQDTAGETGQSLKDAMLDGEKAAQDLYKRLQDILGRGITIPVDYSYPNQRLPPGEGGPGVPPPEGGAAKGVMANRPGLVLFGEGGEPEVGGPADFFRRIFESLGVVGDLPASGGKGGGSVSITNIFHIQGVVDDGLVERQIVPKIEAAWRKNVGGSLTNAQQILGVT